MSNQSDTRARINKLKDQYRDSLTYAANWIGQLEPHKSPVLIDVYTENREDAALILKALDLLEKELIADD